MRRARRKGPLFAALLLVLVLIGLDYAIGLFSDRVELADRTSARVATATLTSCGAPLPLKRGLIGHRRWSVTPPRLCTGPTRLDVRLRDGTVDSCTGFHVGPGHDWRVVLTDGGCGRFEATALPAV